MRFTNNRTIYLSMVESSMVQEEGKMEFGRLT